VRFGDSVAGAFTTLVGLVALLMALRFPDATGQPVGPGMFPALVGASLVALGLTLFLESRRRGTAAHVLADDPTPRSPRAAFRIGLVISALAGYALIVEPLGFHLTSVVFLAILIRGFGASPWRTALLAAGVPVLLHHVFYTLLRVPLPWGVLRGMAW
jgi:putative tricarboxylic transport membrane protein